MKSSQGPRPIEPIDKSRNDPAPNSVILHMSFFIQNLSIKTLYCTLAYYGHDILFTRVKVPADWQWPVKRTERRAQPRIPAREAHT